MTVATNNFKLYYAEMCYQAESDYTTDSEHDDSFVSQCHTRNRTQCFENKENTYVHTYIPLETFP